ncbi:MAG: glutamyl-tRNA reductase [Nitrospiraceae bacterium]|nr:glutamyl-tRNA reductase [Nitrospiraceae bacterium]|tara:strand:+ start:161 stop:1447 length:1287 start_codon:yes stop_codon:yes gene_type:complete
MHIVTAGLNHKTAPIKIREGLAISNGDLSDVLLSLKTLSAVEETMLLSTCNRVELYGATKDVDAAIKELRQFLIQRNPTIAPEQLTQHLYFLSDDDAVRHLFRVASSLDSMVMGEPQILGQFKDAMESAVSQGCTGVVLNKVLKKAISVAKKVRTDTPIGEQAVSVSYAAVELAKKFFQNLADHSVMLVGAGEMGELAGRHLVNHGVTRVMVTTRNFQRAVGFAKQFKGEPVAFETFRQEMLRADIVICSTGSSHPIITVQDMTDIMRERQNKPICIIDIAVPRDVEDGVRNIDDVYLFNIDDLQQIVTVNIEERQKAALTAEAIVHEEVAMMMGWMKTLETVPTIVALKKRAEGIRQVEVAKVLARLPDLSDAEREIVDGLASSIVNKLLHRPLVTLKEEAANANSTMYVDATRRLFSLDEEHSADK